MSKIGLFIEPEVIRDPYSDGYKARIVVYHNQSFLFEELGYKAFKTRSEARQDALELADSRMNDFRFFKSVSPIL